MSIVSQHDPQFAWTVGELNTAVQRLLVSQMGERLWLQGELGRISASQSGGHFYSSLKDEKKNAVNIAYFGGAGAAVRLGLKAGDVVMAYGHVDLYVAGGAYQFIVEKLVPVNQQGQLMQRYLETRKKLEAEGLFAPDRKQPLPALPKCIAVITAVRQGAAAVNDFASTLFKRVPNSHLRMVNARMQGPGTAAEVAAAVQFLNETKACDVIVITRGGGSMEDLWDFNDEQLARTVAASKIPVVSAIGHQIDATMVDYAADRSVITPTDAAIAVTESAVQLGERLSHLRMRMCSSLNYRHLSLQNRLQRAVSSPYLQRPQELYLQQSQHLDLLMQRLQTGLPQRALRAKESFAGLERRLLPALRHGLERLTARQANAARTLGALDPKGVLQRGYSILLNEKHRAVRTPQDAPGGTVLTALLAHGTIEVEVR